MRPVARPTGTGRLAALRAWTERNVLSTRQQAAGSGLQGGCNRTGWGRGAPPSPPPFGRPNRKAGVAVANGGLQVFAPRPPPQNRLTHLVAREPPCPVPLSRPHRAANEAAPSERPTLPPQLACRQRSTRPASPDAFKAPSILLAAPCHRGRIRPRGRNRPRSADRPAIGPRESRTTLSNKPTPAMTPR